MSRALADQAERMAEAVRQNLSEAPDAGAHDRPWVRTGALRDSIAASATGLEAAIGSNDPAAAPQEMGTSRIPPRPFLAPVASARGEEMAQAIGKQVASALRGSSDPLKSTSAPPRAGSAGVSPDAIRAPVSNIPLPQRWQTSPDQRNDFELDL